MVAVSLSADSFSERVNSARALRRVPLGPEIAADQVSTDFEIGGQRAQRASAWSLVTPRNIQPDWQLASCTSRLMAMDRVGSWAGLGGALTPAEGGFAVFLTGGSGLTYTAAQLARVTYDF